MAIYFAPLFCGPRTTLKVCKDFEIKFDDGETLVISIGEKCIVVDLIGDGYNIKMANGDKIFRIMNSSMPDYFDIVEKVEPEIDLNNFGYIENEGNLVELQMDFEIENVVKISAGKEFIHFVDSNSDGNFHDLFSVKNMEKVLRMKDTEFDKYFKK